MVVSLKPLKAGQCFWHMKWCTLLLLIISLKPLKAGQCFWQVRRKSVTLTGPMVSNPSKRGNVSDAVFGHELVSKKDVSNPSKRGNVSDQILSSNITQWKLCLKPLKAGQCFWPRIMYIKEGDDAMSQTPQSGAMFLTKTTYTVQPDMFKSQTPQSGAMFLTYFKIVNRVFMKACLKPLKAGQCFWLWGRISSIQ